MDDAPSVVDWTRGISLLVFSTTVVLAIPIVGTLGPQMTAAEMGTSVGFGVVASGGYLSSAKSTLERERELLQRERDAFDRFVTDVESIAVTAPATNTGSPIAVGTTDASEGELRAVRNAYRTTVMDVDHFDQEYGEGLAENMREELSEDVATAVVDGREFSDLLKRAVIQQSLVARSRRDTLLQTIDAERDSLTHAQDDIREIEAALGDEPNPSALSLTELFDRDRRITRAKSQYERLLDDRQRHLHADGRLQWPSEWPFVQPYLYRSLEVDFPVLATVVDRYVTLRQRQRAIWAEITHR